MRARALRAALASLLALSAWGPAPCLAAAGHWTAPAAIPAAPPVPALPLVPAAGLVPSAPALAPAPPGPREGLSALASAQRPEEAARVLYDAQAPAPAAVGAAAADGAAPTLYAAPVSPSLSPAPPFRRPGRLARAVREGTAPRSRAETWFERTLFTGLVAAAAAPVLYNAAPAHTLLINLPLALTVPVLALGAVTVTRLVRHLRGRSRPPRAPSSWRRAVLAGALGLALGAGLGAAPAAFNDRMIEGATRLAAPSLELKRVPGRAMRDETIAVLGANPVGRRALDGLRDRGGELRLPDFFVGKQKSSVALHQPMINGIVIDPKEITARGWTVERFLSDPEVQRLFVREFQHLLVHELTHAVQTRRSLAEVLHAGSLEHEYEAYAEQNLYTHEQLKADPRAPMDAAQLGSYQLMLEDIGRYLTDIDVSYPEDSHGRTPHSEAYLAALRASWPDVQAEGFELLALRFEKVKPIAARYRALAASARGR